MTVFLLLFVFIAVLYLFRGQKYIARRDYMTDESLHKKTKTDVILIAVFLFLLIGFRGGNIGIDTSSYLWSFNYSGSELNFLSGLTAENGYTVLVYLAKVSGLGLRAIIIFEALIFIVPVSIIIYKYSLNPYLSFFYFIALDYYFFGMTGIRQSIALGFCLIALLFSNKRKFIPFLICIVLATTVHSTAVVFFPVYFISKIPLKKKYVYGLIILGGIVFLFKSQISVFIQSLSRIRYDEMSTGGWGMYLFMILVVLTRLVFSNGNKNSVIGANIIDYMMIVSVIMFPALQFNPTVFRLHYYYSIIMPIALVNSVNLVNGRTNRMIIGGIFFVIAAYYFVMYTCQNMGVVPYSFGL